MRININKDLDEYKDEFAWGFTVRELIFLLITLVIIVLVGLGIWFIFHPFPAVCVYCAIPFGIPTMVIGFYKKQGLTLIQYLKEIRYEKSTSDLCYEANEIPKEPWVWTMQLDQKQKGKKTDET